MAKTEEELDQLIRQRIIELMGFLLLDPDVEPLIKGGDKPNEEPENSIDRA